MSCLLMEKNLYLKTAFLQREQRLTQLRKWLLDRADDDGNLDIIQFSKAVCDSNFVDSFFPLADIKVMILFPVILILLPVEGGGASHTSGLL